MKKQEIANKLGDYFYETITNLLKVETFLNEFEIDKVKTIVRETLNKIKNQWQTILEFLLETMKNV